MKILSIETSCDETAVSIIDASGDIGNAKFNILGDVLLSQAEKHAEYGGVYPTLAKREHSRNLIPILKKVLEKSKCSRSEAKSRKLKAEYKKVENILIREPELLEQFLKYVPTVEKPDIDAIAVTQGPGLEPALWVGINFAKALSCLWNIPLIPINHMEGHIFSALLYKKENNAFKIQDVRFPAVALLISGGHTELLLMDKWFGYTLLGQTRDDAVGEAFDKVARMLGLPYPGGPEISRLAEKNKTQDNTYEITLPRPMLNTNTCDFSFSGLKTAVLYAIKNIKLTEEKKCAFAREFENAVTEILIRKTNKAISDCSAKTLIIGGGVSANKSIAKAFENETKKIGVRNLYMPSADLTGDNSIMIAVSAYFRFIAKRIPDTSEEVVANGNLSLSGE